MVNETINGVQLNAIDYERVSLDFDEAVAAHILRKRGEKFQIIAQKLGTNPARLGEIFRGEKHPGSKEEASRIHI